MIHAAFQHPYALHPLWTRSSPDSKVQTQVTLFREGVSLTYVVVFVKASLKRHVLCYGTVEIVVFFIIIIITLTQLLSAIIIVWLDKKSYGRCLFAAFQSV